MVLKRHEKRRFLKGMANLLEPKKLTRIVEVGANPINVNPYSIIRNVGLCHVWGFEPGEKAFAKLKDLAPRENVTFLPYAIGDGSQQIFHVTRSSALSSLLEPNEKTFDFLGRVHVPGTVDDRVPVETKRLDDIAELDGFDLLKVDVQGGEMMVFDGAARALESALMVITEVAFVPIYRDQPLLDEQMQRLRGHGFDLHKFMHLKSMNLRGGLGVRQDRVTNHRNQLIDGDAVFMRSLRDPEGMSDEQLKHLALLSLGVVDSYDVAVRCLELLVDRGKISGQASRAFVKKLAALTNAPTL
ncbi:FkbM family methyltransferase [Pseudopelagicola sp. nBUS_20]|uniref:FkbM family methyltransferase n=1 Tax=Pseudopelagicola sp. nBUS_20 TaxID=3395317 RepID=UPI003EC09701